MISSAYFRFYCTKKITYIRYCPIVNKIIHEISFSLIVFLFRSNSRNICLFKCGISFVLSQKYFFFIIYQFWIIQDERGVLGKRRMTNEIMTKITKISLNYLIKLPDLHLQGSFNLSPLFVMTKSEDNVVKRTLKLGVRQYNNKCCPKVFLGRDILYTYNTWNLHYLHSPVRILEETLPNLKPFAKISWRKLHNSDNDVARVAQWIRKRIIQLWKNFINKIS